MSKKRVLMGVILLGLSLTLTGCGGNGTTKVDKIVVEQDVTKGLDNVPRVVVEEVKLNLKEGEFFDGRFYHDGKLYGNVSKGYGAAQESTEEYPIYGLKKENLYTLDGNNNLGKTEKKIMFGEKPSSGGTKSIAMTFGKGKEEIYIADHKAENSEYIRETELEKLLFEKAYSPLFYYFTQGNDNYLYFYELEMNGTDAYLGIYDRKNKLLYEMNLGKKDQFEKKYANGETYVSDAGFTYSIFYSKALNSLMARGNGGMCYKVILKDGEVQLSEYIDLSKLNNKKADDIEIDTKNDQALIFYSTYINNDKAHEDGKFKLEAIGKYDFATKQFKILFEAEKDRNINGFYIGKNLFILEEFEIKDNIKTYKNRYILKLEDDEIKTIFKENIEEEKHDIAWNYITINEDGNEIFTVKHRTEMKDGMETSVDAIYKRYIIEE